MKSKIIQITSCPSSYWSDTNRERVHYTILFALCEDGTVWEKRNAENWKQVVNYFKENK